jgi:hypothetical protein
MAEPTRQRGVSRFDFMTSLRSPVLNLHQQPIAPTIAETFVDTT